MDEDRAAGDPAGGRLVPEGPGDPDRPDGPGDPARPDAPRGRRWWQRLPFLLVVGVLPVPFGLFFLAFIAMALLLSDMTRETETRGGGAVLLFWWAYSFREGDTTPYASAILLLVGAVLLVRGGLRRRRERGMRAAGPVFGTAALAVAMAVLALVPYGVRSPRVDRTEAVRLTLAERAAHPWHAIAPDEYLADRGRIRFVHKPVWYIVLYERNPTVAHTVDGEPCFARREVWRVDRLDGSVARATFDDAKFGGDPCLPVRVGTGKDVLPLPR